MISIPGPMASPKTPVLRAKLSELCHDKTYVYHRKAAPQCEDWDHSVATCLMADVEVLKEDVGDHNR